MLGIVKVGGTMAGVVAGGATRVGVGVGVDVGADVGVGVGTMTVGGSMSISMASTDGEKAMHGALANDTCFSTVNGTIEAVTDVAGMLVIAEG